MVIRRLNGSFRTSSSLFPCFVCFAMLFTDMRLKRCLKFPLHIVKCLSCTWERSNLSEIQSLFLNELRDRKTHYIGILFMLCGVYQWATTFLVFL